MILLLFFCICLSYSSLITMIIYFIQYHKSKRFIKDKVDQNQLPCVFTPVLTKVKDLTNIQSIHQTLIIRKPLYTRHGSMKQFAQNHEGSLWHSCRTVCFSSAKFSLSNTLLFFWLFVIVSSFSQYENQVPFSKVVTDWGIPVTQLKCSEPEIW